MHGCMACSPRRSLAFADTVDGNDMAGPPDALLAELDEVAALWHALAVGEALTLAWPARLTIRPGGSARGRRHNRDRGVWPRADADPRA